MAKIPAVLIFGAPGSGKGTVGAKLAATTSLKHISTGDIFRGIAPSSESGKLLASYSSKGLLVPDEATVEIFGRFIEGLINTNKVNPDKDTLLLDGIPRTVAQVKLIESVVDVKHIFVLDIKDEKTIVARLLNRAKIEGRKDDADEAVIKNRLKVYKESTAKVLGQVQQVHHQPHQRRQHPGRSVLRHPRCLREVLQVRLQEGPRQEGSGQEG